MAVAPTQILSSVFSIIYNLLNDNVTDPLSSSRNTTQGSEKWMFASFPDADIRDDRIIYPIVVIDPVDVAIDNHTFNKNVATLTVSFTVFSTHMERADSIFDDCINTMDDNRIELRDEGLTQLTLFDTLTDFVMHGGTRVHIRQATYNMVYYYGMGLSKKSRTNTITSSGEIA